GHRAVGLAVAVLAGRRAGNCWFVSSTGGRGDAALPVAGDVGGRGAHTARGSAAPPAPSDAHGARPVVALVGGGLYRVRFRAGLPGQGRRTSTWLGHDDQLAGDDCGGRRRSACGRALGSRWPQTAGGVCRGGTIDSVLSAVLDVGRRAVRCVPGGAV